MSNDFQPHIILQSVNRVRERIRASATCGVNFADCQIEDLNIICNAAERHPDRERTARELRDAAESILLSEPCCREVACGCESSRMSNKIAAFDKAWQEQP